MKTRIQSLSGIAVVLAIGVAIGFSLQNDHGPEFAAAAEAAPAPVQPSESKPQAAPTYSPIKARARDFYAPNSEDLGPNEMRLIACGTGMPTARPKQAASCWLLELGQR